MSDAVVLFEKEGSLVIIRVNRPKALNALNLEVLHGLKEAFARAHEDPDVAGVLLTGAGERAFVAGADIASMSSMDSKSSIPFATAGLAAMRAAEKCSKPVLAAVNGFALGGGMELALACDFIFASSTAKFGQPEVKLGVTPGFGGTQRLARLVGRNKAKDLILTGRIIGVDEAQTIGLVDRVLGPEELLDGAKKYLNDIAAMGPVAVSEAKRVINEGVDLPLDDGLALEKEAFCGLFDTEDQKEGMTAFMEKRPPEFRGR